MWFKLRQLIIAALVLGGLWWVFSITRSGSPDQESGDILTRGSVAASPNTPAPSDTAVPEIDRDLEIVTLLPKDAIPAVFDPEFLTIEEADEWYDPEELVLGVEINGEAKAYSIPFLSGREIVNDIVGGRKIAVTW